MNKKIVPGIALAAIVSLGAACAGQPGADTVAAAGGASPAGAKSATSRDYTVPAGTTLSLTLTSGINSGTNKTEDAIEATLAKAVMAGDVEVLPAGSTVRGTISAVQGSAKVKGRASMALHFTSVTMAGRSDRYDIDATWSETAAATKSEDATKIGVGAGAGAAIGAVLGGKSGAAKGAALGGGAGTGVVLATKGKEVSHAAGATLTVTLTHQLDVKLPVR